MSLSYIIEKKVIIIRILKELKEKREDLLNEIEGLSNKLYNLEIEGSNNYQEIKLLNIELEEFREELKELDEEIKDRKKTINLIPKKSKNKSYQNER